MSQVSCHHGSFYLCKQCSFTHNELLQRVKDIPTTRAVVELHKPFEEDGKILCRQEECYYHLEFMDRDNCSCVYPCPTIQAIEKELA